VNALSIHSDDAEDADNADDADDADETVLTTPTMLTIHSNNTFVHKEYLF
jgi:hypothetical protein